MAHFKPSELRSTTQQKPFPTNTAGFCEQNTFLGNSNLNSATNHADEMIKDLI